jgi:lethal(2) giant larvae protein
VHTVLSCKWQAYCASVISFGPKLLITLARGFNNSQKLSAEDDEDGEDEWPPFRKVGHFDPFSDDPRLAVKKVSFCSKSGRLIIGGTAGQVVVLDLMDSDAEMTIHPVKTDLVRVPLKAASF